MNSGLGTPAKGGVYYNALSESTHKNVKNDCPVFRKKFGSFPLSCNVALSIVSSSNSSRLRTASAMKCNKAPSWAAILLSKPSLSDRFEA